MLPEQGDRIPDVPMANQLFCQLSGTSGAAASSGEAMNRCCWRSQ
jgi:hypothetical protein